MDETEPADQTQENDFNHIHPKDVSDVAFPFEVFPDPPIDANEASAERALLTQIERGDFRAPPDPDCQGSQENPSQTHCSHDSHLEGHKSNEGHSNNQIIGYEDTKGSGDSGASGGSDQLHPGIWQLYTRILYMILIIHCKINPKIFLDN